MPSGVSVVGSQRLLSDGYYTHNLVSVAIEGNLFDPPARLGYLYLTLGSAAPTPFNYVVETRVLFRPGAYFLTPQRDLRPSFGAFWQVWVDWNEAGHNWVCNTYFD